MLATPATLILTAAIAAALPQTSPTPIGEWAGHYDCAQGATALELDVSFQDATHLQALFYFHARPNNPRVPDGCFMMTGSFDTANATLNLQPTTWLLRPGGYVSVALTGQLGADGELTGAVGGPGCTDFSLTRATTTALRPAPCRDQLSIS